jgi:Ca2+-binding RTX toxin-like protein
VDFVTVRLGHGASGEGEDVISGVEGVIGSQGADILTGNEGPNVIKGSGGDDVLTGISGADIIDGGNGEDWVSYANFGGAVTVDLVRGTATGEGNDTISRVENISGGYGDDTLIGDAGPNFIDGVDGRDTCTGGGGADIVINCP